jgi:hypothetical protein
MQLRDGMNCKRGWHDRAKSMARPDPERVQPSALAISAVRIVNDRSMLRVRLQSPIPATTSSASMRAAQCVSSWGRTRITIFSCGSTARLVGRSGDMFRRDVLRPLLHPRATLCRGSTRGRRNRRPTVSPGKRSRTRSIRKDCTGSLSVSAIPRGCWKPRAASTSSFAP